MDVEMADVRDSSDDSDSEEEVPIRQPVERDEYEEYEKPLGLGSQPQQSKPDKDFAKWEQFGSTIGSDLLKLAGWKPGEGLGKNRSGITKPIEVQYRPRGKGLGTGEPQTRKERPTKEQPQQERQKDAWKKSKLKQKIVYKTIDDILKEGRIGKSVEIVDMRSDEAKKAGKESKYITELRYNIKLLAGRAETRLHEVAGRLDDETKLVEDLAGELTKLDAASRRMSQQVDSSKTVLKLMQALAERRKQLLSSEEPLAGGRYVDYIDILEQAMEFRDSYYDLPEAICALIYPTINHAYSNWRPFEDVSFGLEDMLNWRLLFPLKEDDLEQLTAFDHLIYSTWLPVIRSAITSEWNVQNSEQLINLLDNWRPVLNPPIFTSIMQQSILPKLKRELEGWDPRVDVVSAHSWIQPWLILFGNDASVDSFMETVRQKLSLLLQDWYPTDKRALELLKQWSTTLAPRDIEVLVIRFIKPQLASYIERQFKIDPKNQQLEPLEIVFEWRDLLKPSNLYDILEIPFFYRWLHTLYRWLLITENRPEANAEIARWYEEWKNFFPVDIRAIPDIAAQFRTGLDMMKYTLEQGTVKGFSGDIYANTNAPKTLKRPQYKMTTQSKFSVASQSVSFKETIEYYASKHDILFRPTGKQHSSGVSLFTFGNTLIYLDGEVIFADIDGEFKPVSLETLTQMSMSAKR